ncbi:hypothetical protein B0H17DRAFT_925833 [Mycena rosella]|uniref:DUF7719 domain-containing protein n=1 Tax=Mycena rosella TaxID=1033263 RepID=A0AAD7DX49_MYCRO|nr:hypothetical protein B0H17DRAFT_925833 [Mycena rosella]
MPKSSKTINIPQEEQWRLINKSGVLKKVDTPSEPELTLGDEMFNALLLITPCSFLLLLMEILIYNQYGQEPNLKTVVDRMVQGVPILSIFVFYTSRYKRDQRMQLLLFLVGTTAGSRMLFLLKRGTYLVNMRQCPPLVTLWVYTVIQLDLGLAVLNLVSVGAFAWWKGLELFS